MYYQREFVTLQSFHGNWALKFSWPQTHIIYITRHLQNAVQYTIYNSWPRKSTWRWTHNIFLIFDLQNLHDHGPAILSWYSTSKIYMTLTVFAKLPWPQTVPKNDHNRTKYSWSWIQKMYLIMDVHYWKNYEPHTSYTCMLTSVPGMCCVSLVNITAVVLGAVWRSLMTELGLLFLMGFWLHTVIK